MERRVEIFGTELRYALIALLKSEGVVMRPAELVAGLDRLGFCVAGRPGKTVSDALRWEVRRGRVGHLGRGRYVVGRVPPTSWRRIRLRLATRHHEGASTAPRRPAPGVPRRCYSPPLLDSAVVGRPGPVPCKEWSRWVLSDPVVVAGLGRMGERHREMVQMDVERARLPTTRRRRARGIACEIRAAEVARTAR